MPIPEAAIPHLQNLAWSAALVAIFATAEHSWGARQGHAVRQRCINFSIGVMVAIIGYLFSLVFELVRDFIPRDGLIGLAFPGWRPGGAAGLLLSIVVYGVVWDCFQYWFHRLQHEIGSMWAYHRVHHSDRTVNASTALRRSIPEFVLIFFVVFLPTALVAGIHEWAAWCAFVVFYSWGFFNHANIPLSLGALTPVFSGPQWHRLHHGSAPQYQNCNYAAYFPVLDIAFGTYRAPARSEFPETGIADATATARPVRDCLIPHDRIVRMTRGLIARRS